MNKFKGTSGHIDLDAALALLVAKTARTQDEAGRDRDAVGDPAPEPSQRRQRGQYGTGRVGRHLPDGPAAAGGERGAGPN